MVSAEPGDREDFVGLADEPLQHVQVVDALVDQQAAALTRPSAAPFAHLVIHIRAVPTGHGPSESLQGPHTPFIDKRLDSGIGRVKSLVEHHRKPAPFGGGRDQALSLTNGHGKRLLHQHVQTLFEGCQADFRMALSRRGDEHRIDQAAVDQGLMVGEAGHAEGRPEIAAAPANRAQRRAVHGAAAQQLGVLLTNVAEANDADSDGAHGSPAFGSNRPPSGVAMRTPVTVPSSASTNSSRS